MKSVRQRLGTKTALLLFFVGLVGVLAFVFRMDLWHWLHGGYRFLSERETIQTFVSGFGVWAPVVFILFQIAQVLLAPLPGEASGFIGGYLFGAGWGFLYSTIGLTAGSMLNIGIGRVLGKRYIRKLVPAAPLANFEKLLKRQGLLVVFVLFVIPGFPKDYLCLFLGLTTIPLRILFVLAAVGRMPGTMMLSLQGAYVHRQMYDVFALLLGLCILVIGLAYVYRDTLYRWVEKLNAK